MKEWKTVHEYEGGKYKIQRYEHDNFNNYRCLRYDEEWQDFSYSKFMTQVFNELTGFIK